MSKERFCCIEMYIKFSLTGEEYRFLRRIPFGSLDNASIKTAIISRSLIITQLAELLVDVTNEVEIKNRNPEPLLTPELLQHISTLPITEYDEVAKRAEDLATPVIGEFKGEYAFLSNFYPASFVYNNFYWPNSEAAYQAMKSLDPAVHSTFASYSNPGQAKRAGKTVEMRPDWDSVKRDIMLDIVYLKFKQNPELQAKLLATGTARLEEGNVWKDTYWGVCPPYSGKGENQLGKILMTVRTLLRTQVTF